MPETHWMTHYGTTSEVYSLTLLQDEKEIFVKDTIIRHSAGKGYVARQRAADPFIELDLLPLNRFGYLILWYRKLKNNVRIQRTR